MAIRRRRVTLTNVLSQMDSRIRSTELRQISSGSGASVEALASTTPSTNLGTVVSDAAPCDFIRVTGGKYYSKRVTGVVDKVELYLESDTGAYTGDTVSVYGIQSPYALSGDFVVDSITPTGGDRPSWMDALPGGVTSTVVYSTGQDIPVSTSVDLTTKYEIATYSTNGTVTEALITFTTDHSFVVGDIINASDLPSPYPGFDGAFVVSAVTNNTITYLFTSEIADPINEASPTATSYIYGTAQQKVSIGDTWIDSGTSPSTTYYWNGLRWSITQSGATGGADTLAPADVSNVTSTTSAYTIDSGVPRSTVTLSWDAPTENSDATPLTDLAGYDIWISYTEPALDGSNTWTEKTGLLSADTTAIISGLNQDVPVWFKIFAVDSSLNRSEGVVHTETTSIFALELNAPSAPTFETSLSTLTVFWDGKDSTNVSPPASIRTIEVHVSKYDSFAPESDPTAGNYSLAATMVATTGPNYAVVTGLDIFSTPPTLQTYYIKLVAVDVNGNKSAASSQRSTTISQVTGDDIEANSITANQIDAGSISARLISSGTFIANNLANTAGIEFNSNVFRAYANGVDNFKMYSANGVVQIGSATTISGDSITTGNVNASLIKTGTLDASQITVQNLSANSITSGTLDADSITVTGTISGSVISGGTITGATISGGSLVTQAQGTDNLSVDVSGASIDFLYNGNATGAIYSDSGASTYNPKIHLRAYGTQNNGWAMLIGDVEAVFTNGYQTTVGIVGTLGAYPAGGPVGGSQRQGFFTSGWGSFNEGIVFGDPSAGAYDSGYRLSVEGGRLESNKDFRAAANLNIGADLFWSGTTGTGTTYPVYWNSSTKLVYRLSSSRRYKTNIAEIPIDTDVFLAATPKKFQNLSEVEANGSENTEWTYGFIAEELHDLGLTDFVVYEPDENGSPTVESVNYMSMSVVLHQIVKQQADTLKDLESRLAALEGN